MKKLLLFIIFLSCTALATQCGHKKVQFIDQSSTSIQASLQEAQSLINDFAQNASQQDLFNLRDYMKYYKSWYQSVAPAPRDFVASLNSDIMSTAQALKQIGDSYMSVHSLRPGKSRLSSAGEQFYLDVIELIDRAAQAKAL